MSCAYAIFMAVSGNLRYQLVAGVVEARGIDTYFKSQPALCSVLSFAIRTLNTFWGSLMWVDYVRFLGLQQSGVEVRCSILPGCLLSSICCIERAAYLTDIACTPRVQYHTK